MSDLIKTGVIGHPIKHSKSPLIHNYWMKEHHLNGSYEALDIPPEELLTQLPILFDQHFYTGFNLTIPHKELVLPLCDEIDETAQKIGAVNTILRRPDGSIFGTNTDAFGFIYNIKQNYPHFDFTKNAAVVLGAGGAAKAIIHGLLEAGAPQIILLNRTREKADLLAKTDARIIAQDWDQRSACLSGANLLVNTTALGMQGQAALDINLSKLPLDALVSDIVYAPLMTDLLLTAQQRGNPVITGIGMLLHQARPAFKLWYGIMPEVSPALEALVL